MASQLKKPGCLGSLLIMAVVGLYLISPIDVIPDVIPVIGWVDDIVVLLVGLGLLSTNFLPSRRRKGFQEFGGGKRQGKHPEDDDYIDISAKEL